MTAAPDIAAHVARYRGLCDRSAHTFSVMPGLGSGIYVFGSTIAMLTQIRGWPGQARP
jgi:hypothetical protein